MSDYLSGTSPSSVMSLRQSGRFNTVVRTSSGLPQDWLARLARHEPANRKILSNFAESRPEHKLPVLPSRHTIQIMVKAAVAVYEAAVENQRREE